MLARKPQSKMSDADCQACKAYKDALIYERSRVRGWKEQYKYDLDFDNFKRAYCDAIKSYNRINNIESYSAALEMYRSFSIERRMLMMSFRYLLLYACDKRNGIGRFDRVKVYNFTKKLDAVLNFRNRRKQ